MGIREIRRILDTYSGVSIYRDGFRVYPYGQRGTDWLNLDHRSRQLPVKRLANNQVVAVIRISRESTPGLRDRSNREGMVLNSEHATLERSFKEILSLLEERASTPGRGLRTSAGRLGRHRHRLSRQIPPLGGRD